MADNNRMPALGADQWDAEQRQLAEEIIKGPRGALLPPFEPLLRSPELMGHAQRMGEYLRYRSSIGQRLSELAILVIARHWRQPVEWAIHGPIAEQQGIARRTIQGIRDNQMPDDLPGDERLVWQFCQQLNREQSISDGLWAEATATFGEKGVMDLIGLNGYYSFLAMVMNSARTPPPASDYPVSL